MRSRKSLMFGIAAIFTTLALVFVAPASSVPAGCNADFDEDGTCDLAVGSPYENVEDAADGGGVNVLYNGGVALSVTGDDFWTQSTSGTAPEDDELEDPAETSDRFAAAIAAGDFNDDGASDLVVGVPLENTTATDTGAIHVIMADGAGGTGLDLTTNVLINQTDIGFTAASGDKFGHSLAVGDFDGDGIDDLAAGAPYENSGGVSDSGAVNVLYGDGATGLDPPDVAETWHQNSTDVGDSAETSDRFGWALAAGDLNGDTFDDLVVGIPYENTAVADAGAIQAIYGGAGGLQATAPDDQFIFQSSGTGGTAEASDLFGIALEVGDINGDAAEDLVVGAPYEDTAVANAGLIHVLPGDAATDALLSGDAWDQSDTAAVAEASEAEDRWGWDVAIGNFDDAGDSEVAVGVPYEDVVVGASTYTNGGSVEILYDATDENGDDLLDDDEFIIQGTSGDAVVDKTESGDYFGFTLAVSDFDGATGSDLIVAAPYENIITTDDGVITVIPGSAAGLDFTADVLWHTNIAGVRGGQELNDLWGYTMAG